MNRWTWTLLALAFAAPVLAVAAPRRQHRRQFAASRRSHGADGKVTPRFAKLELEVDLAAALRQPVRSR